MGDTMKLVLEKRAKLGALNDAVNAVWDRYAAGEDLQPAIADAIADAVIKRYEVKLRNGLSRAGVELEEGERLDADKIKQIIEDRTGLELESLSPATVVQAVDKKLAARLSEKLGTQVTSVLNKDTLIAELREYVVEELRSGRAAALISRKALKAARRMATLKRAESDAAELRRASGAEYQKRYRRTHKQQWVPK